MRPSDVYLRPGDIETYRQISEVPATGQPPALAGCSTAELQRIPTGPVGWARTSVHPVQSRALYH